MYAEVVLKILLQVLTLIYNYCRFCNFSCIRAWHNLSPFAFGCNIFLSYFFTLYLEFAIDFFGMFLFFKLSFSHVVLVTLNFESILLVKRLYSALWCPVMNCYMFVLQYWWHVFNSLIWIVACITEFCCQFSKYSQTKLLAMFYWIQHLIVPFNIKMYWNETVKESYVYKFIYVVK